MTAQLALTFPLRYVQTWEVACPKCGRAPDRDCRAPRVTRDGVRSAPKYHRARQAAALTAMAKGLAALTEVIDG